MVDTTAFFELIVLSISQFLYAAIITFRLLIFVCIQIRVEFSSDGDDDSGS
jgi:hypothetical protein